MQKIKFCVFLSFRAESVNRQSEIRTSVSGVQLMFNYRFIERRTLNVKKKMEVMMTAKLLALTSCLASGSIEVIVLSLPGVVIRSLAAYLVSFDCFINGHYLPNIPFRIEVNVC